MKPEEHKVRGEDLLVGGGEIGAWLRSHDWSPTPLGAIATWSDSLKTAVQILLSELDRVQPAAKMQLESDLLAFRVKLTDALRPLSDAVEIQAIAAQILGDSLGASRVIYLEVLPGGKEVSVYKNYTNGVAELSGQYCLEDFGRNLIDDHQSGQTVIAGDVANSPQYTTTEKNRYRKINIAAYIDVPLIKNNQFVALLGVHQATPRQWTEAEVKQVEETAEQTWEAVERAHVQAALQENRAELARQVQKFDATLSTITDFIFRFDREGRFVYANQVLLDLWGLTAAEAIGKTMAELQYPEAVERQLLDDIRRVFETGELVKDETPYTNPAGVDGYFEYILSPVFAANGTVESVVGSSRDISDRISAEAELRESETRLRFMLDASQIGDWDLDLTTEPHTAHRSLRHDQIFGYESLLSEWSYDIFLSHVHPDDRAVVDEQFQQTLSANTNWNFECRIVHHDQSIHWIWVRSSVYCDISGTPSRLLGMVIDITDRVQTETALNQSEKRYQTLFESIDEGFCIIEVLFDEDDNAIDYRFLEVNPAFEQQSGLQQAIGKTACQLNLEAHWIELYGKVALTGESVRFENGSKILNRWFDVYACGTGEPEERKVAIVFKDISDRQRAEEIARRTAELNAFRVSLSDTLRSLVDPSEIQAVASRVLGEYLGANRVAYFEVRGTDYFIESDYVNGVEALAGRYPIDSFGSKLLASYRRGCAVSASDVEADPNLSPEQRSAYAAIQIGAYIGIPLVKQGKLVAGLAVHTAKTRDWTADEVSLAEEVAERTWAAVERAFAEAALRDSEDRFRMAIEAAQLGTWDWNLLTNQLVWDEGCKAMFGLPPRAESSIEVFFAALHPNESPRLEQAIQWALNPASGGEYNLEYRIIGIQDGVERWIAARGQVYFDASGTPQRFVGTVLNITKQKRIESEREQLLQREQAAREAAERANQVKNEFLAVLSHELRSPLNPILGWTRLLQNSNLDAARRAEALKTIEHNAKLQAQLIEDLLDISRIMQGKLSLTAAPVDLTSVIAAAIETVRLAATAKNIRLALDLDSAIAPISGDAVRLQQVVWNLLTNAVKFTPNGGQVNVELRQLDGLAQIRVIDTGKGINPQFLPYVFEYFRQEDGSTTRKFGGLGLGLAIVRQIVEMHGGRVTAESQGENQGATLMIQLPIMQQTTAIASEPIHTETEAEVLLDGVQILLVDDEPDNREFEAFLLEQNGANVTAVASGLEALQALDQFMPDVLVSDIGMTPMDGYMLMQQIRSRPPNQGGSIQAIALTAYAAEIDRQKALQVGFQTHITKPVEAEKLVRAIANLLEGN